MVGFYKIFPKNKMINKKAILLISAFSPPITGVTVASNTILSYLKDKGYPLYVVDYAKGNLISGKFSLKQFFNIIIKGLQIIWMKNKVGHIYLAISSTFWGNMRDIFFLFLIGKKKRMDTVLHLHTATFDKYLGMSPRWVKYIIRKMFGDAKAAIVVGETFINTFDGYISTERVKVVKNCAKNEIFIPQNLLIEKYSHIKKVNILFLGNLIQQKGYELLLDSYMSFSKDAREKAILNFAGEFPDYQRKTDFLNKIKCEIDILYHGPVQGREKIKLLWDSHIFCLPTYYYEAQPISILEAYASGCIVLTSDRGGIRDIFKHGVNGYWTNSGDKTGLRNNLYSLILDIDKHKNFAFHNRQEAIEKYTEDRFDREVEEILLECNP